MSRIWKTSGAGRLIAGASLAVFVSIGAFAAPASAAGGRMEAILGGHLGSQSAAQKIANEARAKGFKTYVQKIRAGDFEAEIFNGGTTSQAQAACAKARHAGLPHCSVEREGHGNGWGH